ncbi:hypothetical protein EJ06DRAFT_502029 [Trichodelitschia bisporula]|uniref:C2H2-type domain-containing protein n=1 Tax=Trichodelitschia bisporula TaxID=703511 RepID=A0A6G1I9V2_9PEZI|nr:hypothetical protein EJ06DRAFT_502029 [Trichodelitschia bisporula]
MSAMNDNAASAGQAQPGQAAPQPQQQSTPQAPQPSVQSVPQSSVAGDQLVCQWQGCGERCATAEQLYDHVCERHVGRKSTNNLNLTCQWGNCRTTTVKRDHITSHIRVHVPLKPHKCDFCGKAFKRPQDLKKHVKTHADDSVLLRSPEPNRAAGAQAYPGQQGKLFTDLQALAATASGYYPDHHGIQGQPVYYPPPGSNPSAYHGGPSPQQGSAYGPVYYAVSQPQNSNAEYELRKRAAFDALNEFFGDAKRRAIDPTTYYDVGHRLMALQNVQLPILNGYAGGVSDYGSAGPAVASAPAPLLQPQYSLPLPNLRTKSDLVNIDQFLEQLQSTVYENSSQAAAAGVAQPGTHYVHSGVNYRTSHSPPHHHPSSNPHSGHATAVATTQGNTETPALTPASSVMSYHSGHSPSSVHSTHTISPPRPMGTMYPTLPAVSAMSDVSGTYASTSSAPPSGLATSFDPDARRRYSGGILQKEAPAERMDLDDSRPSSRDTDATTTAKTAKMSVRSPSLRNVDPALRSPGMQSEGSEENPDLDRAQEAWVENVRIIEALRQFIKELMARGEYANDMDSGDGSRAATPQSAAADAERRRQLEEESEAKSLYPVLREVQGGA